MTTAAGKPRSEYKVIGKRIPKVGGVEMVTGQAVYGADVNLPGMLYARVLRSPHAHARIKRIDVGKALALEGVKAVLTGQDMPPVEPGATYPKGKVQFDLTGVATMVLAARDTVLFVGHPVAAVAATDPFVAEEALGLIEVEYEPLPAVLDVLEAMKPGAPIVDPNTKTRTPMNQVENEGPTNVFWHTAGGRGNVENGFKEAEVVVEQEYRVATVHQGYIEPQASVAQWRTDGSLTVWTTTQGSFQAQSQLVGLLGLTRSRLNVVATEIGGGFGGKNNVNLEPLCALLSRKAGRPVKGMLSREEVLKATGPAAACVFRVKIGARRDGTLTAIQAWMAFDSGCAGTSFSVAANMCAVAPYNCPNVQLDGYDVLTNKAVVGPYRGPTSAQTAFAIEQTVDMAARAIGMDPLELRMKNASDEGDVQATGVRWNRIGLKEVYRRAAEHPHWRSRLEGPNRGRGLATGFWPGGVNISGANVTFNSDGTASVLVGIVDVTGTRTSVAQMVAEELEMSPADVSVSIGSTDRAPYADLSGASRITRTMSVAVQRACQDLLAKLRRRAADKMKVKPEDLEYSERTFRLKGAPEKFVHVKDIVRAPDGFPVGTGSVSEMAPAPAFAVAIVDVEVDPETGKVTILRHTAIQDCGKAVNPTRVEAQMQGGAAQGIGWALTEEYLFDGRGDLRNASLLDYRQPTAMDVPTVDCEIVEVPASDGPYGIRGVGEVAISAPAAAIGNAIARAAGVRVTHMPMTMERVFKAMQAQKSAGK